MNEEKNRPQQDNQNDTDQTASAARSTPVELLASVLEQRYSRVRASGQANLPDPISFPAVQKALGSVYSAFVEITGEDSEAEAMDGQPVPERTPEELLESIDEMAGELLERIEEIEKSDSERSHQTKRREIIVEQEKSDPYNRARNTPSRVYEIPEIPIEESITIETKTSRRNGKK